MPERIPLTIATGLYNLPINMLAPQMWQLSHQTTAPLEILIVSPSPDSQYRDTLRTTYGEFPLVRIIDAPQHTPPPGGAPFNASLTANIAIKHSNPAAQFISFIGAGLLFNETSLEALGECMDVHSICEAQMALLPADYKLGEIETLWERWDDLVAHLDPYSRTLSFAPGSLMCASREWYFKVHGFDEMNYSLAYNDSDLHRRARLSGLNLKIVPWGKMQMVHIIHPRRYPLPAYPDGHETNIIANGEHWGEIEASA